MTDSRERLGEICDHTDSKNTWLQKDD